MALKNFTQFTPQILLSATDYLVGYRDLDEIRTDLDSMSLGVSAQLISKGFLPGTTIGSVRRTSYRYTININSPVNAVSGADDNNRVLSYTPGQIEVYRNGSHLAESLDFLATNSTQILNLSTLNVGDILEVVALSGTGATIQTSLSGFLGNIVRQNYRYSVATGNTIVPGSTIISGADDYGSVLYFNPANFQVYLNGSHLVRDYDFTSYTGSNSFTLAMPVAAGDSVDVISLSACFSSQLSAVSAFSGISKILGGDRVTVSGGTGNVTVSSQTCISDFPAADWTNASHITRWTTLQAYLSGVAQSNTSNAVYTNSFATAPGNAAMVNLVNLPNGKIYVMPHSTSLLRVIDPTTDTVSVVATIAPGVPINRTHGGVLAPNGCVYTIPASDTVLRKIDPSTHTVSIIANLGTSASQVHSQGGVLGPNGKIYLIPCISSFLRMIDPSNDTQTIIGTITPDTQYQGANCLAPNGKIYMFPSVNGTMIRVIDPSNNQISSLSFICPRTASATLAPNGKIYLGASLANAYPLVFDPQTETISTFAAISFSTNNVPNQDCLLPNGKIFSYNGNTNSTIMILDPVANTATTIASVGVDSYGLIMGPNGKVYLAPYSSTSFVSFSFLNNNNFDINVATNPFFNKN